MSRMASEIRALAFAGQRIAHRQLTPMAFQRTLPAMTSQEKAFQDFVASPPGLPPNYPGAQKLVSEDCIKPS